MCTLTAIPLSHVGLIARHSFPISSPATSEANLVTRVWRIAMHVWDSLRFPVSLGCSGVWDGAEGVAVSVWVHLPSSPA
jgi:hypothetical protein